MKIRFHTMSGQLHSWSVVSQSIAREINKLNHQVFLKSTNSLQHFPKDLIPNLLPGYHEALGPQTKEADFLDEDGNFLKLHPPWRQDIEDKNRPYDMDFAYTVPLRWKDRFYQDSKLRVCIWNYETDIMPPGWNLYTNAIDYLLPSSDFSYDIFAKNGIPKDKMLMVPHGVDENVFNKNIPPFKLKTNKKVKFLLNAIPHMRKLHGHVFKAYFDAFTDKDDVCLVLKTKFLVPNDPKTKPFEVNVKQILEDAKKGRKNLPEIEIINDIFIEDIGSLYTACDCTVCMSATEGYTLPLEEAMACGNVVIAPRYGGHLTFLNDSNSLLVDAKEVTADFRMQYWEASNKAVVCDPSIRHCSELMRYVYENLDKEKERVKVAAQETVKKFSWENAAKMILDLPVPAQSKRLSPRKKVLYIIPYNMAGGAEMWVREAIRRLDNKVYEAHIACVSGYGKELQNLFGDLNVTVEDLSTNGHGRGLKCLVEAGNYSIIHFHNSFSVYRMLQEAWREGFRCRIVETVHSDLVWNDSMSKVSVRDKMVCAIVAVSNDMGNKLIKTGNKNVFVLPQQIDWDRFLLPRSKEILNKFGIPNEKVVGFVGRLSQEKNIPAILKCASIMPEVSFVIIGDGPQKEELLKTSKKLNNVFFVGSRKDVENFYVSFDMLLLPSFVEGMPLVLLEAIACGTPVVASNVGAIGEIISNNGEMLKNQNSAEEIKNSINKILTNWETYNSGCKEFVEIFKKNNKTINDFYKLLY